MDIRVVSQIFRFLGAGGVGVCLYYATLSTLTEFVGVQYFVSAIVATILNITSSFVLQKFWTFKNTDTKNVHKQLITYLAMAATLAVVNLFFLHLLVEVAKLHYLLAQAMLTIFLTILSYFCSRWIFSKRTKAHKRQPS